MSERVTTRERDREMGREGERGVRETRREGETSLMQFDNNHSE